MINNHLNVTAQTRFIAPSIPNATIRRTTLAARLDAGKHCALTLVAAAPGSGKTALLTQWARTLHGPVAWLSCDVDDGDSSWFWRDVITAIRNAWKDVALGDCDLTDDRSARHLAIEIANELASQECAGVIVIDDFHLAAPEPAAVVAFIEALPQSIRTVLGTRHDPLFPLGRMRIQGRLLEVRQADLRFTRDEIVEALANLGITLDGGDLDQIAELTEGWAAGVHLAGLSLGGAPAPQAMIHRLAETDRSLVDFLMNEVVDLQSPAMLEFLTVSGELGEFDAELCDTVMQRTDSRTMIDEIRAANLFLIALDEGSRFRYHHLFGDFLRARLRRVERQRVREIHLAAADAFSQRGNLMSAVRHSLSAGDIDDALARLTTYMSTGTTLEDQAVGGTIAQTWLDQFGATALDRDPEQVLACVVALNGANRRDAADEWLRRVEAKEAKLDERARCALGVVRSFNLLYRGNPAAALDSANGALAIVSDHPVDGVWIPSLPMMILQAQLWLDDADGATATVDAYPHFPAQIAVVAEVRIPGFASNVAILRGDYRLAERLANQSMHAAQRLSVAETSFAMAEAATTLAELALEQGRLSDAEGLVEWLMRIVDSGRRPLLELKGHLLFARLALARDDHMAFDVQLERARSVFRQPTDPMVAHIDRVELHRALVCHDLPTAEAFLQRLPPSFEKDLAIVRLRALENDVSGAARQLALTAIPHTPRQRIGHGILTAIVTAAEDHEASHDTLNDTLALAHSMGYHQTIVDEGPKLWTLMRTLRTSDDELTEYVAELLGAAAGTVPPSHRNHRQDLIDPLSARELTVLRYLTSQLGVAEIAATMYLSANTVRSHVKAIYRKLGVNSRADAVRAGRSAGLA